MTDPFHVVCSACKTVFKMQKIKPGRKGNCPSCGGELVLPNRPLLICDSCGNTFRAKGALSLAKEIKCTKCNAPLRAADSHESATTRKILRSQQHKPAAPSIKKPEIDVSRDNEGDQSTDSNAPTIQFLKGKPAPSSVDKSTETGGKSSSRKVSQPSQPIIASQIQNESDDDDDDSSLQLIDEEDSVSKLSEKEKHFGEYRVESEIARGGMGIVYKAYDQKLRRTVALKVLLRGEDASNQSTIRFLREARALAALNHANIVSVYSVGEERGQFYYTMEYVDGYDLAALVAKQKTPLRIVLGYIREICLALDAAHRRGIIHRDLKPQNILIHKKDNRPQIMDFGLAKDMTSTSFKSLSGSVLGTPSYMSPEQAKGETRSIDHRTDIYSMGVILYELATGSRPFGGDTVLKTIEEIVNKEPMAPIVVRPNLDKDLNTIILKCLDKNPDKRYQRMPLLAEDLGLYLEGEPINARALSPLRRVWRFVRRNRAAMLALTIIPTIIITALIVNMIFGGQSDLEIFEGNAKSDNPRLVTAALLNLESLFIENLIKGEKEFAKGLAIARSKIKSPNNDAAEVAMRILAANHDVESVEPLLQVAKQQSFDLERRKQAISNLVKIGPKAIGEVKVDNVFRNLKTIVQNMQEDFELRIAAARALDEFPKRKPGEILLGVATKTDNPLQLRLVAINILGQKISFTSPYMNDFLKLQGDEAPSIIAAVEGALARSRTRTTVFALYGIQDSSTSAMEGIADIHQLNAARNKQMLDLLEGGKPSQPKEEDKPLLAMIRKLNSGDENLRMAAAYDLGELGDEDAISPLVIRLTDPVAGVRRSTARALLKLAPKANANPLDPNMVIQLLHNSDSLIRDNAAFLLGGLECKEARPALITALENESSQRTIRTMIKALSSIRGEGALDAIRKTFDNTSGITAQTCLRAMVPFGSDAASHLIHALDRPGEQTRAIVLDALREISGENYGGDAQRWKQWMKDDHPAQ